MGAPGSGGAVGGLFGSGCSGACAEWMMCRFRSACAWMKCELSCTARASAFKSQTSKKERKKTLCGSASWGDGLTFELPVGIDCENENGDAVGLVGGPMERPAERAHQNL